jgi:hypothetical protein
LVLPPIPTAGHRANSLCTDRGKKARLSRDQCGATAGHIAPGAVARGPNSPPDLAFCEWGGEDLNLRPTDYESAALTD